MKVIGGLWCCYRALSECRSAICNPGSELRNDQREMHISFTHSRMALHLENLHRQTYLADIWLKYDFTCFLLNVASSFILPSQKITKSKCRLVTCCHTNAPSHFAWPIFSFLYSGSLLFLPVFHFTGISFIMFVPFIAPSSCCWIHSDAYFIMPNLNM